MSEATLMIKVTRDDDGITVASVEGAGSVVTDGTVTGALIQLASLLKLNDTDAWPKG